MMDDYLDENVGKKVRLLPDLLRSLERERDLLQDQVGLRMEGQFIPYGYGYGDRA